MSHISQLNTKTNKFSVKQVYFMKLQVPQPWGGMINNWIYGMFPPPPPPPPPPPNPPPPFFHGPYGRPPYPLPPFPPPFPPLPYSPSSRSGYDWESGIRVPGYPYYYNDSSNYTVSYPYDTITTLATTTISPIQWTTAPTTRYITYTYPWTQTTTTVSPYPTLITTTSNYNRYTYPYWTTQPTVTTTLAPLKQITEYDANSEPISIVPTAEDAKFQKFLITGKDEKLTTEGKKRKSAKDGKWENLLDDHDTGDISESVIKKPPPLPDLIKMRQSPDEDYRKYTFRKW